MATWNARHRCVCWNQQTWLRGLGKSLKLRFYPHYRPRQVSAFSPPNARRWGKGLDSWVSSWTRTFPRYFPRTRAPIELKRIWQELMRRSWKPVGAQVPIGDPEVRCGTLIDLVCEHNGQFILVEIKTGYQTYHDQATGFFRAPLDQVPCSPLNQHLLYLSVIRHWWTHQYPERPLLGCYVWRVDEHEVHETELPTYLAWDVDTVMECLKQDRHLTRKRKRCS